MSRRVKVLASRTRRLASVAGGAAVAALLLAVAPVAAQHSGGTDVPPTEAELLQRLAAIAPEIEEVGRAVAEYREHRFNPSWTTAPWLDTLQVGLVTVVTTLDQVEITEELYGEVWETHFAHIEQSKTLAGARFSFQWSTDPEELPTDWSTTGPARRIHEKRWTTRAEIVDQIRRGISANLGQDLAGTAIGEWGRTGPSGDHLAHRIYRELATSQSFRARSCHQGDVADCMIALQLDGSADDLERWYTPAERRALVRGNRMVAVGRDRTPLLLACFDQAKDSACTALLRDAAGPEYWAPLQGSTRASVLGYALERGGPEGWQRLVATPKASVQEALETASGLPLEELVAEWQAWVIEGQPDVYSGLLPKSGLALAWTLLFAGLGMRSTRWRLG